MTSQISNRLKATSVAFLLLLGLMMQGIAIASSFFEGTPINKITISEEGVTKEGISGNRASEYRVVVEEVNGEYFWASRGNVRLTPIESGAYTTFMATNGSGYIRILAEGMRNMGDQLPESERGYYYSEHLIHQMGSITYQGR